MSTSYQQELPKSRINITLDVETGDAKRNMELPFNVLVLGDFTQGKTKGSVADREKININKDNFDKVIRDLSPELNMAVVNKVKEDGSVLNVNLVFESIDSFHPEQIARNVPEIRNLIAMRNLLKDLRSNILDNVGFRREVEKILRHKENLQILKNELDQVIITAE